MSNWGHKPKQVGTHYIKSIEVCVYYKHIDKKNIVLFSSWYVRYFLVDTNHDFSKVSVLYTKQNIPFWQGLCELHCPVDTHTHCLKANKHMHRRWEQEAGIDGTVRKTANVRHTRRWRRHHGGLMPERPSQWGCPVKSQGMSALLCFYTQVERWKWGEDERCMQEHTHTHIGSVQCKCSGVVLLLSSTVVNLWTCDAAQAGRLLRWKVG